MNSATACLESSLRVLGIGQGDEVIVTPYTYTASCSVICHVGATPVMVDLSSDSFEMNYDTVFDAITERTKAIIPVDIGGILCNYDRIFEILNSKKKVFCPRNSIQEKIGRISVISDSAHSFGSKINGKISGSIADFTAFSFHAVKNLTTAEGGALTWTIDDDSLYDKLSLISLHGQNKDAFSKINGGWEYDILYPGYKTNMTDILASIGLVQLDRFDDLIKKRRHLALLYNKFLSDYDIEIYQENSKINDSTVHLYITRFHELHEKSRNELIEKLLSYGIYTNVHYKPLPILTAYKKMGFNILDFPNAFNMYENEITLPLHTKMDDEDIDYVCSFIKKII